MTSLLLEEIRINAQRIVDRGVVQYEKLNGRFKIDGLKKKFLDNALELLLRVVERTFDGEEISVVPLKDIIAKSLFDLDFDTENLVKIYSEINKELIKFIKKEPNYDSNITRIFNSYLILISENIDNYSFYAPSSVTDIVQNQPEYQYSDEVNSFTPKEIYDNTIYTLFTRNRDWEVFSTIEAIDAYNPLSYNRVATKAGFPQYRVNVSYEDLVVYEGELYKLRPDISSPTKNSFELDEWTKYTSRYLDKNKTFRGVYLEKIRQVFGRFSDEGFTINEVISDSYIQRYKEEEATLQVDRDLLPVTFAGVGKQILETTEQLEIITDQFGSYEGSVIGGLEYVAQLTEYLLAASFGKDAPSIFEVIDGSSAFGRFNILFLSKTSDNKIPGLKFLNGFGKLRSFAHGQRITPDDAQNSLKVVYNPVFSQFSKGIENTFNGFSPFSGYSNPPRVDLLLFSIESMYRRSRALGDLVKAGLNSLDKKGRMPGYEGLGSVVVQLQKLQSIFPPSTFFLDLQEGVKIGPGLTGALRYLLNSYSKYAQGIVNPVLPGRSMEFLGNWIDRITNKLEELLLVFDGIGLSTSSFIPNLSFRSFEYKNTQLIGFLRSLGFRDSEIEQLLNVQSFSEMVEKFAPLSESSDLKSFFKAYELSQLIYEFGGQDGIDAYLNFLYTSDSLDSLLNILSLSQKEKSKIGYIDINKYPKLIGLLIGLTYAVDPQQLIKFNKILGENNLSLLESISFLYQNGETTIIKNKDDVSVLQPMIDQIIQGGYVDDAFSSPSMNYSQVNSSTPIALRQWTKEIEKNLGKVDSVELLKDIFDKSIGITPKELITILNNPESSTYLGRMVDGFSGGEFTSFLRYANIAGLGIKLGTYKNSYQVENFEVKDSGIYAVVPNLILTLKQLIDSMSIVKVIFTASLDYTFTDTLELADTIKPLILAQNKTYSIIPQLIEQQTLGTALGQREVLASDAEISESPGIGNSRLPNRVPAKNSITPEQFSLISNNNLSISSVMSSGLVSTGSIKNFLRFADGNRLASEFILQDESTERINSNSRIKKFSQVSRYEDVVETQDENGNVGITPVPTQKVNKKTYKVPKIYMQLEVGGEVKSSGLGSNYIEKASNAFSDGSNIQAFDPISSCKRFGGSNCEELYENSQDRCVPTLNKSLFPETYSSIPSSSPTSVVIDRPLGTFAQYVPLKTIIPTSSFNSPPGYYSILPEESTIGERGEPLLPFISQTPIINENGSGDISEFGNTEFGVIEFIRGKLEKNSELGCAGFESPYLYQICTNILKCKKFKPPLEGDYYLNFCPRTLSGGRLK